MPTPSQHPAKDTPPIVISIAKWDEIFESSDSRKRKSLDWVRCPAGCDSNGYLTLVELGKDGLAAFGVFQALCQLAATYPANRRGRFIYDNGDPMTIKRLASLTRISEDALMDALDLLAGPAVGWVCQSSADDLPPICQSSASHLPVICQSSAANLPLEEKRREEKRREEKRASAQDPPPPSPDSESDPLGLDSLRKRINGWFGLPVDTRWTPGQLQGLADCALWDADTWAALEAYYRATVPVDADKDDPLRYRRQSHGSLAENLPAELTKALKWAESRPTRQAGTPRKAPRWIAPPCDEWRDLGDEIFDTGWPRNIEWPDLGREAQLDLWKFYEKKTAAENDEAA